MKLTLSNLFQRVGLKNESDNDSGADFRPGRNRQRSRQFSDRFIITFTFISRIFFKSEVGWD